MAVFTTVSDDDTRAFLTRYTLGDLVALEPIAEGVENTNYRLETGAGRKVLTLFERRTDAASLPFCLGLTDHLAAREYPAARPAFTDAIATIEAQRGSAGDGRPQRALESGT